MAEGSGGGWILEVARAIYSFKATVGKTLSFREHEQFLIYHPSTKEKNWWQVINRKGQVGYVPSNYVTAVELSWDQMREFVCDLIERVQSEGSDLPIDRQELLNRLQSRLRRLDGQAGADEKSGLSRTPSIISIPPVPAHSESSSQPPPVPPHKTPLTSSSSSRDSTPSKVAKEVSSSARDSGSSQPPPLPSYTETLKKKQVGPPVAEKTVSVKRRVAELASQLEGNGVPIQATVVVNNTGTIKRSSSKTRSPSVEKPPSEVAERSKSAEVHRPERRASTTSNDVTGRQVYQLVDEVRRRTELSHELSRVAVAVVAGGLQALMPSGSHPLLTGVLSHLERPLSAPAPLLEHTHDAQRLHVIFSELTSCKDDAQQRSWMLHEDEHVIIDYIKELTSILTDGDSSVCKHVLSTDQYSGVQALVQYYQMETRWSIRQPLLTALGVLCGLDPAVVSIMLTSVLPCELARDMSQHANHVSRLCCSALLLTMIFSMGEPMPVIHLEHVGEDFICFVLEMIESPPESDVEEQIPDLFVSLLLSYNLQFQQDNPVVRAMATRQHANTFTEKILMLLNREDDPVRIFSHEPRPPNSILKLCTDVFASNTTAALFYTNDVKVLIEIVVRQLADLSPGDKLRHEYLWLARVVLRTPGYAEHRHRRHDLHKCFTRIFCEETEASREDQKLVREISNEFPNYFKA